MFDFHDFNDNEQLDPAELFVGASMASSFGYGAALADAEERERRKYADYEDELEKRQERIDELEEELEELRGRRDYDYYDDDEWEEDDWEDDEYDKYGYNKYGYDKDGYDENGLNVVGLPRDWNPYEVDVIEFEGEEEQQAWIEAINSGYIMTVCMVEGDNPNGPHGTGVYANGKLGGYLPPDIYNDIWEQFYCGNAMQHYKSFVESDFHDLDKNLYDKLVKQFEVSKTAAPYLSNRKEKYDDDGKCVGVESIKLTFNVKDPVSARAFAQNFKS